MNSDQIITPVEPAEHPQFNKLFAEYLTIINENKADFITYNSAHQNHTAHEIFSTYWYLEATSSTTEPENVRLTRKDAFTHLPEKLRALIN